MAGRGIDGLGMARRRPVAAAVVRRAQMRATFQHLSRNPDVGQPGIVAAVLLPAAWVLRNATRLRRIGLMLWRVPVGGPLPDIPDHVVQAVAVRRKRRHRRGTLIAIFATVLVRKLALPGVGHVHATG